MCIFEIVDFVIWIGAKTSIIWIRTFFAPTQLNLIDKVIKNRMSNLEIELDLDISTIPLLESEEEEEEDSIEDLEELEEEEPV